MPSYRLEAMSARPSSTFVAAEQSQALQNRQQRRRLLQTVLRKERCAAPHPHHRFPVTRFTADYVTDLPTSYPSIGLCPNQHLSTCSRLSAEAQQGVHSLGRAGDFWQQQQRFGHSLLCRVELEGRRVQRGGQQDHGAQAGAVWLHWNCPARTNHRPLGPQRCRHAL